MRRFVYLLLLGLFVSASASCVSASTDCERWYAAYRQELAHSRQVQRIAAAKRRAKLYAQRKIAQVQAPKPKLVPVSHPRMTRKQTLRHIDLACGVLPEGGGDEPLVSEETPGPFSAERPTNDGIDLLPAAPGELIAENDAPPPFGGYSSGGPSEGGPAPYFPGFGGSGGGASSGGGPGKGVTVPPPPPPPVTPPPVSVVPEPASFVYLLTGLAGAAGAIRRRFKA
jgi:uncharacterized membrane protein YgcG